MNENGEDYMTELQKKLTEMLSWFHNICVENNLTYYASSGTMLGVARHQGFIPWDDDADVMMPREDMKKLEWLLAEKKEDMCLKRPTQLRKIFSIHTPKFTIQKQLSLRTQDIKSKEVYL